MKERTKLREYKGWPDACVEYMLDGCAFICNVVEWQIYEIKFALVASGADEDLIEEIAQLSYSNGYSDAEMDHAESESL